MESRGTRTRARVPSAASAKKPNLKEAMVRLRKTSPPPAQQSKRNSPTRRSSRSRSIAQTTATTKTTAKRAAMPSPIKEKDEISPVRTSKSSKPSTPTTATSLNTSANKLSSSKSTVQSETKLTYTTTATGYNSTRETFEVRTEGLSADNLAKYLRRSVSKTISLAGEVLRERTNTPTNTNTEMADSRYSRSVSRSIYEDDDYSKVGETEEQDEYEEVMEEEHFRSFSTANQQHLIKDDGLCRKLQAPREFGGFWGLLGLLLSVPTLVYYLQYTCNKPGCTFRALNISQVLDVSSWSKNIYKGEAVSAYFVFYWTIYLLSLVLFGRRIRLPSSDRNLTIEYKFNLLPMAVLLTLAAGVAEYLKYPVANFISKHYMRFLIYGIINAFVVALWTHVTSIMLEKQHRLGLNAQINIYGKTGNSLIDFALGKRLNPKWCDLISLKLVHYRICLLVTLLLAECFIYKNLKWPSMPSADEITLYAVLRYFLKFVRYDASTLLAATLLLLYVLDAIIFEHHLASSFELNGEGFGCLLLLRYAVTPYMLSAVAKYFFDRRIPLTCKWAIYVSVFLLLCGLLLKRLSNAMKYKYRIDPAHPSFQGMETIHTFQGRRLLLGPLWGRLRQPNYLGDILALIGLATPIFLRFVWPPVISVLLLIVLLLHRALRVNARNTSRYHSAWVRYRCRARNYVIPRIF